MKIGIFHPPINNFGGREYVIIRMIKALNKEGHKIVLLSNYKFDRNKFSKIYNEEIMIDFNYVFPLHLFNENDWYNIYTDILRCKLLKSKCDLVIDASTNSILPNADISYIHYPFLKGGKKHIIDKIFYLPLSI